MAASSRCMTFMERSTYSQSIELDQNFVNGLWLGNTWDDDRIFGSFVVFRPDDGSSGDFFGDGQYGWQTRWTCLPIYEDEGRHLLHLGLSGGWRDGFNSTAATADSVRLRARPELRDDDPAASPAATFNQTTASPGYGGQPLPDANANRLIDTGAITCNNEYLLGTELLYIRGPWSFQAEYGWNFVDHGLASGSRVFEDYTFYGGYLQLSYILTGEYRHYDEKSGLISRYYLGGEGPYENAFMVRDALNNLCCGRGAWELAVRYDYVDLNSALTTGDPIRGGLLNGVTVALNWYLNTNLSVMTDWNYNYRFDASSGGTGAALPNGSTNGFGMEVQLSF